MTKFLITKIDKKDNNMWLRIEDGTICVEKEMIYDKGNGLSDIVTLDIYRFDKIDKFIEDYGDQYILLYIPSFIEKTEILKINKYNIDKLYQKECRGNIYFLYRCYTEILNCESTTDTCIEILEIL